MSEVNYELMFCHGAVGKVTFDPCLNRKNSKPHHDNKRLFCLGGGEGEGH